jgi:hypothetical protein
LWFDLGKANNALPSVADRVFKKNVAVGGE